MIPAPARDEARTPKISFVSLGCPKALVDSERIVTRLRAEGYELAKTHAGADAVIVNTCGFLDSAKAESLAAAVVAGLLVVAAVGIAAEAVREIVTPHLVPEPWTLGVLVAAFSVKWWLMRRAGAVGDATGSAAVRADAGHHLSDAVTSAAAASFSYLTHRSACWSA